MLTNHSNLHEFVGLNATAQKKKSTAEMLALAGFQRHNAPRAGKQIGRVNSVSKH
jgi:hypothetical protein